MIVTVRSFKGGVGKTTSAVHVAAHFSRLGPTLLVDADANRSALVWARHGRLPFIVADERQAARAVRDLQPHHTVIDTAARPDPEIIETLAKGCDFLIVPTTGRLASFRLAPPLITDRSFADLRLPLALIREHERPRWTTSTLGFRSKPRSAARRAP